MLKVQDIKTEKRISHILKQPKQYLGQACAFTKQKQNPDTTQGLEAEG